MRLMLARLWLTALFAHTYGTAVLLSLRINWIGFRAGARAIWRG